ncbi:MAG: hypothetical protein PHV24_03590 [Candidatus Kapabacteria bacterium]|nr:hypothetical protein [Candidatus Kapabacteria bacterium]
MKEFNSKSYFDLTEHNAMQFIIFAVVGIVSFLVFFQISLPFQLDFFEQFLLGDVHYSGDPIPYSFTTSDISNQPNLYFSWAVDFDVKSSSPTRYWYNPMLSVSLIIFLIAALITTIVSSVLPRKFGYIRQKIERETVNLINKFSMRKFGCIGENEQQAIISTLQDAKLEGLHEFAKEIDATIEDVQVLKNALRWLRSSFFYRLFNFNKGLKLYLRFHITIKYSNFILGLVYIGASILILTIGLRGIKFIPPTQPSYILFSLCVEFSILLIFASTTMYQRQDDENEHEEGSSPNPDTPLTQKYHNIGQDYGPAREVEQLLKMFIKSNPHQDIK